MNILYKLIRNYTSALKYFFSIAKNEFSLSIFLVFAIICQIIFGFHLFENVFLAISYSIGIFIFISIAYSIVYSSVKKSPPKVLFKNINIQLIIIGIVIILDFLILSGQFPQTNILNKISEPVRLFFCKPILDFGFTSTVNGIIISNIIQVLIPLILLLAFTKSIREFFVDKLNLKVLILLTLLYLPVILFGQKSLNKLLYDLPIYLLIAAIPEEFLFRGLLQSRLESIFKKSVNAILLASIIFGLIHLPVNIKMYGDITGIAACIGNNAFGGLFIGYLFYKTRSIWTIIIFHLISGIALT